MIGTSWTRGWILGLALIAPLAWGQSDDDFAVDTPEDGLVVFADSAPQIFSWTRGRNMEFQLIFTREGRDKPRVTSGTAWFGRDSFDPGDNEWRKILRLVKDGGVIQWRLRGRFEPGGPIEETTPQTIAVAADQAPVLDVPVDGQVLLFGGIDDAPEVQWTPNHNERFRLIFSDSPTLNGTHQVTVPKRFSLTGDHWNMDNDSWARAVELVALKTPDGVMYVALESIDLLGRVNRSGVVRVSVLTR